MDVLPRSGRRVLTEPKGSVLASLVVVTALGAASGVAGCGPKAPEGIGTSTGVRTTPRGATKAGPAAPPRLDFLSEEEARGLVRLTAAPAPSRHHFVGSAVLDLYANAPAAEAYAAGRRSYPAGALFVVRHTTRDGRALPTFAMEKLPHAEAPDGGAAVGAPSAGGGWRYIVTGEGGAVTADGELEACALCHREAPTDAVFTVAPSTSSQ